MMIFASCPRALVASLPHKTPGFACGSVLLSITTHTHRLILTNNAPLKSTSRAHTTYRLILLHSRACVVGPAASITGCRKEPPLTPPPRLMRPLRYRCPFRWPWPRLSVPWWPPWRPWWAVSDLPAVGPTSGRDATRIKHYPLEIITSSRPPYNLPAAARKR